jgi:dienelactone hydrolase
VFETSSPRVDSNARRGSTRRIAKRIAVALGGFMALVFVAAAALWLAAGTRWFNERMDSRALRFMARTAERGQPDPAGPRLSYRNDRQLEALTRPAGPPLVPVMQPMPVARRLGRKGLTEEVLSFPSAIALAHPEANTVSAYVYRHGRLGERPIVLWVPGLFVSNLALSPISWFTRQALDRGADVVLYVPPYHLERTPAGYRSGEAFFATSLGDHLSAFAQELSDLRRLAAWLRAQGAGPVGAFGASLGALELLRLATWDDTLDFLTVFIPVVRPTDLIDRPEAEPMRRRLAQEGGSLEAMRQVYGAFDLTVAEPPAHLVPARISVIYGRYDLIATPPSVEGWARRWGVTRLYPFPRGHTLSLFHRRAHEDYGRVLEEDLRAFGR